MQRSTVGKAITMIAPAVAAVIYVCALSVLALHDKLLSNSVDLAHHLQLVEALKAGGALPASSAAYLNEMYVYPNLAHRLAALWVGLGSNSLNALGMTAYAAGGFIWLCLIEITRRISLKAMLASLALTLLLIQRGQMLLGQEVVGNFFYAQLVAEAFFVGSCIVGVKLVTRAPVAFAMFAPAAVFISGEVHQLGALKLALALALLATAYAWRAWRETRQIATACLITMVSAPLMLVANPHFLAMAKIAGNNGSVEFGVSIPPALMGTAAALLLALSLSLLMSDWRKPSRLAGPAGLLAMIGAATAIAALLQSLAWSFGAGSEYAVLKHAFGVITLLVFIIPAVLFSAGSESTTQPWAWQLSGAALMTAHLLVLLSLYGGPSRLDVDASARLLARVEAVAVAGRLSEPPLTYFVSARHPAIVNYMATVAVLHTPRDALALAILQTHPTTALLDVPEVLTERGDRLYDAPPCRQGPSHQHLVLLSGRCLSTQAYAQKGLVLGARILFKAGEAGGAYLKTGWSAPELGGAWSSAQSARVVLPLDNPHLRPVQVHVQTFGFLPSPSATRTAIISVSGGAPRAFTFNGAQPSHLFELDVPAQASSAQELTLNVQAPDAISPAELGLGPDTRRLGVGIEAAQIVYAPRGEPGG